MKINSSKLICAPITERRAADFLSSMAEAEQVADAIELRFDYLEDEELLRLLAQLPSRVAGLTKPLVFTYRPREQGGQRELDICHRLSFWRNLSPQLIEALSYADFELDLVEGLAHSSPPIPWSKVICSYHNLDQTPDNLMETYQRMVRTPAAVVKIATRAVHLSDCLHIFELLERRVSPKPVIALAMGGPGLMTRVLALAYGAMLTFGALRRGAESASGQPTVAELRDLYRVKRLSRASEIFGLIGYPIGHSRSPAMHNAAFAALGRDAVYLPFEVDHVAQFVRDFVRPGTRKLDWQLRGLSVTIPHKLAIMPYLDFIDPTARRIGAVNTVVVAGDQLCGYNTDLIGAMKPLDELIDVREAKVAVIGAGGAARAVCYGLSQRGAAVTIYARDLNKAERLADEFQAQAALLESFTGQTDIVINCTPIGMRGHSEGDSPVKPEHLQGVKLVYDLIYNPAETTLLEYARQAGCRTLGGLAMLVAQAAEQFRLWTGEEAPVELMWQAASGFNSQSQT